MAWVSSRAAPAAASVTTAGWALALVKVTYQFCLVSCIMQQEPLQVYTYHWPFMSAIETGSQQPVLTGRKADFHMNHSRPPNHDPSPLLCITPSMGRGGCRRGCPTCSSVAVHGKDFFRPWVPGLAPPLDRMTFVQY